MNAIEAGYAPDSMTQEEIALALWQHDRQWTAQIKQAKANGAGPGELERLYDSWLDTIALLEAARV